MILFIIITIQEVKKTNETKNRTFMLLCIAAVLQKGVDFIK
jgi:hypothetical protein